MPRPTKSRRTALVISFFGILTNLFFTLNVLAASRAIRWEPDSEWEGHVDSLRLVWGLLFAKFAFATGLCVLGFFGTLQNNPTLVRLYRDYSIADFATTATLLPLSLYIFLRRPLIRTSACEALARQPEFLRELLELGLSLENCEPWLESAALGGSAALVLYLMCRLHALLAVARYHSSLAGPRSNSTSLPSYVLFDSLGGGHHAQRVYVLPADEAVDQSVPVVYAPVALHSIPDDARARIAEAWLASGPSTSGRAHHHHHHRRSISGGGKTGRIALPVGLEEGLFSRDVKR